MRYETMIKQLEKRREAIGKERDKLRDLQDEAASLLETCERAHEDLQHAIDALSELA